MIAKHFTLMSQKQKSASIFFRSTQILPVNRQTLLSINTIFTTT